MSPRKEPYPKPVPSSRAPSRQMWRRSLWVLVLLVFFGFSYVVAQLVTIQLINTDTWQQRALQQQLSDTVTSPNRGAIYDVNRNLLAESQLVWTIIMSPKDIETEDQRKKIADELSVMLDIDRENLYERTGKKKSQYEIVKKKIDRPLADTFLDWVKASKETDVPVTGSIFRVVNDYKRVYPYGSLASCVLGFTGTDNTGLYGLEMMYEKELAGKAGRVVTARNGWGDVMPNSLSFEKTIEAENGHALVLSLDQTIQHYAEKHLDLAVRQTGCTNRGIAIVMNVKTGAILAMATKNDYNLNDPFTITDPDRKARVELLSGNDRSAAVNAELQRQWNNKAIFDFYEPGSVFKIFTAAMGIEEGVVSEQSTFNCGKQITVLGRTIKCHATVSHGTQTLPQAISNSCNPALIQVGLKVGNKNFFKYYKGFGFTERTDIDMLGESAVTSALYHKENMSDVSLATVSIGQTFKVTPIQMITAVSAVANGGKLMIPYVVAQELDGDGHVVRNTAPQVRRQVISQETARRVSVMLEGSVNGGGGKNAYVPGYRVAGKTGTADYTAEGGNVWASFCGFAPADDPQIAVLVILDQPQCTPRFGGTIAAPVAQKILADTLPYLGIEPQYTAEELEKLTGTTPAVEGKTVERARTILDNENLKNTVVGDGASVIRQVPDANTPIPKGGMVVLYTEEYPNESNEVTVPNFGSMTVSQANAAAASAGVNLILSGLNANAGDAFGDSQTIEAGEKVTRGTVVTVSFIYRDSIQ